MCRHLAYLGPPCAVGELLGRGEHSLLSQGWAPRDMRGGGTINADGYGVAWWVDGVAVRYRTARPVWNDDAGAAVLGSARSGAVLAAVRSATVGMPVVHTANAPFTDGRWAFSHNGTVRGWPASLAGLAARLPITDLLTLDAPTDSALLWAAVRAGLAEGDPAEVLADLVRSVGAGAPESRLNLLLSDGVQVVATAWYHSLSVLVTEDAVLVASEPHDDDPAWRPVPDHSLVTARPGQVTITPLNA